MGTEEKIRTYIKKWESQGYRNGIPDEAPAELEKYDLVTSYKRICRALIKNDLALTSLGFSKEKCRYYSEIKRIEIEQRPSKNKQLKLNL